MVQTIITPPTRLFQAGVVTLKVKTHLSAIATFRALHVSAPCCPKTCIQMIENLLGNARAQAALRPVSWCLPADRDEVLPLHADAPSRRLLRCQTHSHCCVNAARLHPAAAAGPLRVPCPGQGPPSVRSCVRQTAAAAAGCCSGPRWRWWCCCCFWASGDSPVYGQTSGSGDVDAT